MDSRARDIRDIAPFVALPRSERIALAASSRFHDWNHGDCLFHAEKPDGEVIVLIRGLARLYRAARDESEVTISIVPPGHILNIGGLTGAAMQEIRAEAVGTARTIHLATPEFLALGSRCPSFFEQVASALVARTDALYADAMSLPMAPLATRILNILQRVARPASPQADLTALQPLAHRLTQAEIARLVGAHRSSVTRALAALEEQGLVRRERGRITGVCSALTEKETEPLQAHRR
ncbi:MAG TPA: Crp/Fnr family transcriptional regulator [Chloroflexota bacterium]|nr:Crp/Fnr family transcriptional regulator [Chloroflexota bacterium]